jgi:two-component system, OmpR family, phosphate regulon response regulator PhoB
VDATTSVLVACADEGLRGQVSLALDGERFEVDTAEDTDAAVHALAARLPSLLIVDLHLGGAGSLALARTIRRQPETRAIAVLLVVPPGEPVPDEVPGVDGVLVAPFTALALLRKVDALLAGEQPSAPRP